VGGIGLIENAKLVSVNSSYFLNRAIHIPFLTINDKSEIIMTNNSIHNNSLSTKEDFYQES